VDQARCSENSPGLVALVERLQPAEMGLVERPSGADRQADAVQRQRIGLADHGQATVRRPTGAHVVLRVDFEEADLGQRVHDFAVVLMLEPNSGARRNRPPAKRRRYHIFVWHDGSSFAFI
jgi:hypothetical protein